MRFFLNIAFMAILTLGTAQVSVAQTNLPVGCIPEVHQAQQDKARALVAQDVAAYEEVVAPSDSVLATSCFDQAARVAATEGGQIFSGEFVSEINDVVLQPVQNLLNSNFLGSIGRNPDFGGVVTSSLEDLLGGTFGGLLGSGSFDCSVQQDIFDTVRVSGINGNVEFLTMDEFISAAGAVGVDSRFLNALSASASIFQDLQTSVDALPVSTTPSFNNAKSLDDVLNVMGIAGGS